MKKFLFYCGLALSTLAINSCGDDDEPIFDMTDYVGTKNVFDNAYIPAEMDGIFENAEFDDKGRVTKMSINKDTEVIFNYTGVPQEVIMTQLMNDETLTLKMTIGANHFVSKCVETSNSPANSTYTWEFKYNNDGQLTYIHRSEDNETTKLEYQNGDIATISITHDGDTTYTNKSVISYTKEDVPTAIDNKHRIMFFEELLGIDLDEMEVAYYAGLLGKPTKHLPMSRIQNVHERYFNDSDQKWHISDKEYTYDYGWVFQGDKPTKIMLPYNEKLIINW